MKINVNNNHYVNFKDIDIGDVFSMDNDIYMRINRSLIIQ